MDLLREGPSGAFLLRTPPQNIFGPPPVVESLAACSLSALEAAAERNGDGLRPRWQGVLQPDLRVRLHGNHLCLRSRSLR